MKYKKSLSTVIATMILILLSITAVGILGVTLKNLADTIQMSPKINCLEIETQPPLKIQSAYYNSKNNEIEIMLKRSLQDKELNEITFVTESSEWLCGSECSACILPDQGQTKTYYLNTAEIPDKISLKIGRCLVESKKIIEN